MGPLDIRISIDDGHELDFRVLELLEKYKIADLATFYIAPYNKSVVVMHPVQVKELAKRAEIGGHTMNHALLTKLSKDEQVREIIEGKMELENIIGKKITKFAYPKGWFNPETKDSVKLCGFKEARTMKLTRTSLEGYDEFELPISFHVRRRPEYEEQGGVVPAFRNVLKQAQEKGNGYLGVALHSWEVDREGLWNSLEKIFYEIALSRN
tara:strand:+ start:511 stop:1140 length:630 start_codon:yes stop_codon:yes gene_type:complete